MTHITAHAASVAMTCVLSQWTLEPIITSYRLNEPFALSLSKGFGI